MSPPAAPRATRLTGRAAVLAVVICAIALSLAYPVREYVNQRRQIDALVAQQQSMLAQVKNLQAQQARLSSPAYIEQLARQELNMCFPGTRCYIVEGGQPQTSTAGEHGEVIAARDTAVIAAQLGRAPRGLLGVAHRCPCGLPDVAETAPRLPDGSPFPTLYYLTCPRAAAAVSKLEAAGLMREMSARLTDDGLRRRYEAAHRDYLARREMAATAAGVEPLPPGTQSAGGMPERVKCLHALVAHELAAVGVNPFGAEALEAAGAWWRSGPCVDEPGVDEPSADEHCADEPCVQEDAP
jgi:cell division protein FtsL